MSHPSVFWSDAMLDGSSFACGRTRPSPRRPYGCTGPAGITSSTLLMSVSTALSVPGALPKKSGA